MDSSEKWLRDNVDNIKVQVKRLNDEINIMNEQLKSYDGIIQCYNAMGNETNAEAFRLKRIEFVEKLQFKIKSKEMLIVGMRETIGVEI